MHSATEFIMKVYFSRYRILEICCVCKANSRILLLCMSHTVSRIYALKSGIILFSAFYLKNLEHNSSESLFSPL